MPRRRSASPASAAAKPTQRGLSSEQVPILVAADRTGTTISAILPAVNADSIKEVLAPVLGKDALLVTDGALFYPPCAAQLGVTHETLNQSAGERVRGELVTDPQGTIGNVIALEDVASKGRSGRTIPISKDLREALRQLQEHEAGKRAEAGFKPAAKIITSERGDRLHPNSVAHWFQRLYGSLGFDGCSSHSGRRTAITKWARNVSRVGGSLRDVQELAGHSSLQTTQRYVQGDTQAKRRLVDMN